MLSRQRRAEVGERRKLSRVHCYYFHTGFKGGVIEYRRKRKVKPDGGGGGSTPAAGGLWFPVWLTPHHNHHTPQEWEGKEGEWKERGGQKKKKNSVWDQTLWNPLGWKQQGRTKKGKENIKYDKKREINLKRTRRLDGHGGTIRLFGWECVCVCVLAGAELCNRFKLLGFMGVCAVQCSFPETPRREWQNVQHQRV